MIFKKLELKARMEERERMLKMQQLKDKVEVAQLIVESEEVELIPDELVQSEIDKGNILASYLQDCTLKTKETEPLVDTNAKLAGRGLEPTHQKESPIITTPVSPIVRECRIELPKVELSAYYGEVTDYWRFIKQFEFYVEARTPDPGQRLLYLMNYCKGPAKEEIKNCIMLPPDEAYSKARSRLGDRFGQPHVIARALINDMLSLPRLTTNDPVLLSKMVAAMSDCKLVLGQMNYMADLNSIQTLGKLVSKLPIELRQLWSTEADKVYRLGREPGVDELIEFIDNQARIARSAYGRLVKSPDMGMERAAPSAPPPMKERKDFKRNVYATSRVINSEQLVVCPCCSKSHTIAACPEFVKLPIPDRWNRVEERTLCFLCLKGDHQIKECRSDVKCSVGKCERKHHPLLHYDAKQQEVKKVNVNATTGVDFVQLGTIPVLLRGPKGSVKTYALIDNGSDSSLVRNDLLARLGLSGTPTSMRMRTVIGEKGLENIKV